MNKEMKKMQEQINKEVAVRERKWQEMDVEQKLDRLREVVRSIEYQIERQSSIVRKLEKHQHLEGGELVTLLSFDSDTGSLGAGRSFSRLD